MTDLNPRTEELVPAEATRRPARFTRRPNLLAVVAVAYLFGLLICVILAPLLAPYSPTHSDFDAVLQGPSSAHWLGTDSLGRDVLSRLLFGGRVAFADAAVAVVVFTGLGVLTGVLAGYFGGMLDRVLTALFDLILAMPGIVVLLGVMAAVGTHNTYAAMVTLGVLGSPGLGRVVRGATLAARQELYVSAAKVSGLPNRAILGRYILPRVAGPVIVQTSLAAGGALMIDAGLSYLGLGTAPPAPSWGNMITEASTVIDRQPWLLVPPGLTLALATIALGLLGDSLRDANADRTRLPRPRPAPREHPAVAPSVAQPPDQTATLSLRNLQVRLPMAGGLTTVIEQIDLDIAKGETVGLVGESGCGKSITSSAIVGLLPANAATSGVISFGGVDLNALGANARKSYRGSRIGLISQESIASLDPMFPAGSQVAELVRRHHGGSRRNARRRALDLLEAVHLPDPETVYRRYPHELSGGMAQRVAIAMALAGDPDLLIADEPTTALDVTVQAEILDLFRELQSNREMSILLVTHDLGVVADACHRAYVMYAGHIVESCDVARMFDQPRHPYTVGLRASTPSRTQARKTLPAIPGRVPDPANWPRGCHFADRCYLATVECTTQEIPVFEAGAGHLTRCLHYDSIEEGSRNDRTVARGH